MPIMRFDHLTILTRNIEASWEFYHQLPNSVVEPWFAESAEGGYFEVSFDDSVIGVFDSSVLLQPLTLVRQPPAER